MSPQKKLIPKRCKMQLLVSGLRGFSPTYWDEKSYVFLLYRQNYKLKSMIL